MAHRSSEHLQDHFLYSQKEVVREKVFSKRKKDFGYNIDEQLAVKGKSIEKSRQDKDKKELSYEWVLGYTLGQQEALTCSKHLRCPWLIDWLKNDRSIEELRSFKYRRSFQSWRTNHQTKMILWKIFTMPKDQLSEFLVDFYAFVYVGVIILLEVVLACFYFN